MWQRILIGLLGCVLCGVSEAATVPSTEVRVAVYNDARVEEEVLERAQEIAAGIYARAGVTLVWSRCGKQNSLATPREPRSCSEPGTFSVRVVSKSLSLREESFGVAFLGSDGVGTQADVFYAGIVRIRQYSTSGDATILGHVMAHELGHLLLGMNAHSRSGIMQARWTSSELRQMELGGLVFNDGESVAMRSRLLGRAAMAALEK